MESNFASHLWLCQKCLCKRAGDPLAGCQSSRVQITLTNRQRRVRFDAKRLRRLAAMSLAECARQSGDGFFALKQMPEIDVAVVSDAVIARVHVQFMAVPGATDVITFDHGEIVVSADTADKQADAHGHGVTEELALYIIHGLLHLNGYDDIAPRDRAKMHRVQNQVWSTVLAKVPAPSKNQPCKAVRKAI
jgi:probable rRNA maturation factor